MPPPYTSYAALAAEQAEGVDYRREHRAVTGSGWLSMAVHGGRIEPATAELASYVAGSKMSYYGFIGTKPANNSDLHITSTNVDYPDLLAMTPRARRVLSFHGYTGTGGVAETAVGGLDAELVDTVRTALTAAGFAVVATPSEIAGTDPTNICNEVLTRRGCQLELSRALRDSFSPDGDITGGSIFEAGARSPTFYAYAAALGHLERLLLTYDQPRARVILSGPPVGILDTFTRTSPVGGDFEQGVGTWVGFNATLAATSAQAHTGARSLAVTATGVADAEALHAPLPVHGVAVTVGTTYRAELWFRAATATRTCQARIHWYTNAGVFISTSTAASATDSTTGWTLVSGTAAAPATAAYAVLAGRIVGPGGAGEVHYLDDAVLTDGGWGDTNTSGHHWTSAGGSDTDHIASGGWGRHRLGAVNSSRWDTIPTGKADWDVAASVATDVLATGGSHFLHLAGRFTDPDNAYTARLAFTTTAAVELTVRKRVGGTETLIGGTVVTGLTHVPGTFVKFRFRGSGTQVVTLQAKAWAATDPPPSAWAITETDSSSSPPATGDMVGVRSILSSANTNPLPVHASWNEFATQGFTVLQRSPDAFTWTNVRGGTMLGPPPTRVDLNDYEFTADVTNYYRTRQVDDQSGTVLLEGDQEYIPTPLGGVFWLKSTSRAFLNVTVTIIQRPEVRVTQRARLATHAISGRTYPVAVNDLRLAREWTLILRTETPGDTAATAAILAPGDVLLLQVPAAAANAVPAGYLAVGDVTREHHPLRPDRVTWTLPVTEVAPPDASVATVDATWASVVAQYATWADVVAAWGSWEALLALLAGTLTEVIVP